MANILNTYISKVFVSQQKENDDVITINTKYLSPEGDVFTLDTRTISPSVIPTTSSINELQPEISTTYPYKTVTPTDSNGYTLILTPSITTFPTASQNYYAPIYLERYKKNVLEIIDKQFTELSN